MNKATHIAIASCLTFSANLHATETANTTYFGANYEMLSYDEPGLTGSYTATALALKAGHFLSPTFAIEAKLGLGLGAGSDTENYNGLDINFEINLDSYFSILAVGFIPVNEKFNVYGKLGFSNVSLSGKGTVGTYSATVSDSGTSPSFYFGGEYIIQQDIYVNAELGSLYNRNDVSFTGLNFGLTKRF